MWLQEVLESKIEISTVVLGPGYDNSKAAKVLTRTMTASDRGYTCEAGTRHAEITIRNLVLQSAATLSPPGIDVAQQQEEGLLDHERFKQSQSTCARANFRSIDRTSSMQQKSFLDQCAVQVHRYWSPLERLGRYIVGKPRLQYQYEFQEPVNHNSMYADANWAFNSVMNIC